jgi:DNA-binding transcriptional LysR family regulator
VTLDLFRLLVFVTVVDRHGYSAAARQLHLSQSTVSHHVSELERSCGTQLLQYKAQSVHLTLAGQEVHRSALLMLAEQDKLTKSLADLHEGHSGRIRLGASLAFEQKHFLAEVIAPYCRAHSATMLSLRFGHSRREAQAVLDNELDLAYVIRWHLPGEAQFEYLHDAELTFLASPDHPLAAAKSVDIKDIAEAGFITTSLTGPESFYYRDKLRELGITGDRSTIEIEGQQARFLATAAGLGVMATFVPVPKRGHTMSFDTLTRLPVEGPPVTVDLGLVLRPGKPGAHQVDELAAWLRKLSGH